MSDGCFEFRNQLKSTRHCEEFPAIPQLEIPHNVLLALVAIKIKNKDISNHETQFPAKFKFLRSSNMVRTCYDVDGFFCDTINGEATQ